MKSKSLRKLKRKVNKQIRYINSEISKDNLWKGRFVLRIKQSIYKQYADKSGYYGHIVLRAIDKKTGKYKEDYFNSSSIVNLNFTVWEFINTFITRDIDVWKNENPYEEIIDWSKKPIILKEIIGFPIIFSEK